MARTLLFSRLGQLVSRSCRVRLPAMDSAAPRLPRRALLAGSTATLLGCSVQTASPPPPNQEPARHRIAIVGAGLSGLTCAYWLISAGVEAMVYEAGSLVGGRVRTLRNELPERLFAELGGEFIEPEHATMHLLASALGIALDPYFVGPDERVFWVAERRVQESEVLAELADVSPIIENALEVADETPRALANLDRTPLARWLERNVPAEDHPASHALLDAAFRAEFGVETEQQSALNLVYLFGAGASKTQLGDVLRYRARDGNDVFAARLEGELAVPARRQSRLRSLRKGTSAFTLTFESPTGVGFETEAERVVLAIPFSVLRTVDLTHSALSTEKRELIDELAYGSHSKTVGAFSSRDWGRHRQVITDSAFQLVWDSSFGQASPSGVLTNMLAGTAGSDGSTSADAQFSNLVVHLDRALSTTTKYVAGSARRLRWSEAPLFRGSVASPRWGTWQAQILAGAPEGDLHFCGEHTSLDFRGTMEGAAESGALVAAQILDDLGVTRPAELQRLLDMKRRVPQPCLRNSDAATPRALTRRRNMIAAHREFMLHLESSGAGP